MWKSTFDCNKISEIRLKTTIYFGCGAIVKINDIAKEMNNKNINKVLCVTGKNAYKSTGAWAVVEKAFADNNIEYILFDECDPNPTVDHVDKAAKIGSEFGAQLVLGIGGGSAIDTAKSAAIIAANINKDARQLYRGEFTPELALPIIAINLTHGTGTEANRVAVASIPEDNHKPAIVCDCLYPWYSIDDPCLMTSLSPHQTRSTAVDAVNHVIESATTIISSPYSIYTAKETIAYVAEFLPKALENPDDKVARYWLAYAAMMAGSSFDNGLLHITHALEHPLSALHPEFTHGAGLAMLLPAVVKEIYPTCPKVLASILEPITGTFSGVADEAEAIATKVEEWLFAMGLTEKLEDEGFTVDDISTLTELAFNTPSLGVLLSLSPKEVTKESVSEIYKNSLKPRAFVK